MADKEQVALRVSQLDSSELDGEIFEVLKSQFNNAFKYFKPGILAKFDPELNAAIRLGLWQFSVNSFEATIGQQLLELKYKDVGVQGSHGWIGKKQKLLFAFFMVGLPWLQERIPDLVILTKNIPYSEKFWKAVTYFENVWKVASLVNFLIFLQKGHYQFISERLLNIRSVFPKPQGVRQVGFEYMDRELLWHGFAEFLFFVLPLVNFRRVKNFISRKVLPQPEGGVTADRSAADLQSCVCCGEWPYSPQEIGCRHVFCYYCIMSNLKADPSFSCPECGQVVESAANVSPVLSKISKKTS